MYLTDTPDAQELNYVRNFYGSPVQRRRPPPPPTSIALDDGFDAASTDVITEFNVHEENRSYEESVTGYQNYVNEMERMLSGQLDLQPAANVASPHPEHSAGLRRVNSQSLASDLQKATKPMIPRRSLGNRATTPNNARKVSGKRGVIELVQQKVMEDSSQRTISLWRERVAQTSAGDSRFDDDADADVRSEANGHAPRKVSSGDSRTQRVVSNGSTNVGAEPKNLSYERSEYMVSYHQASRREYPKVSYAGKGSELGQGSVAVSRSPRDNASNLSKQQMAQTRKTSPTHHKRQSSGLLVPPPFERSEYTITYPQTPPHSSGSASSPSGSPLAQKNASHERSLSPLNTRGPPPHSYGASTETRATSTSSVELVLASCEPSLLHIAPVLSELGIQRLEHLRAVANLTGETRDREVKEQALKRGISVMEWAIFIDKLQSLK